MTKKFVILAGPTATGKTNLAVQLSRQFPLTLISADSRQVYRQADIVTGKDQPEEVEIHCLNLCRPNETVSISLWFQCARRSAHQAWQANHLPFFVGGTGFYLKALTSNIETMTIPPNYQLRKKLSQLNLSQLQSKLKQLNPHKYFQLNHSDKLNPRRLIRAIEISLASPTQTFSNPFLSASYLYFVLTPPPNYRQLIRQRVIQRLEAGAIVETQRLLDQYSSSTPVFQSLGYPLIIQYLEGKLNRHQLIEAWTQAEFAYAKRQLVWFKKQPSTIWLSAQSPSFLSQVAKRLKTWYDN